MFDKEKLDKDQAEWDRKHPSSVSRPYILSEFNVENPKHSSLTQIKNELKIKAREKCNLKPIGDFSVDDKPPPSLKYVETPDANGKKMLLELRKQSNLSDLKRIEAKQGKAIIGIDRLMSTEECLFRQRDGKTTLTNYFHYRVAKRYDP